jgi:hypothetical protein
MKFAYFTLAAWMAAACTKPNPAVCCLDQADCDEVGISEVRECSPGLACVEHQCEVPTCSMTGCEAGAPVCNITTDVCDGCTTNDDCSRFAQIPVCDTAGGGCVECVSAGDCPASKAICDANACRGCNDDADCASGACADDGVCVPETSIVYLIPTGTDAGSCPQSAPCKTITYGLSQLSTSRNRIVMAIGGYVEGNIYIGSSTTSATELYLHGSGATLAQPSGGDSDQVQVAIPTSVRNMEFFGSAAGGAGHGISVVGATLTLDHVTFRTRTDGIGVAGTLIGRDLLFEDVKFGIGVFSGNVTLDRAEFRRGITAIQSIQSGGAMDLSNVLVWGTTGIALDLSASTGSIAFSTIADSGADQGTGPRAVNCSQFMNVRSSIIWAPGSTSRVPISGCNVVSTIAGPTTAAGATNINPQFVDPTNHDYHITATSPAKDLVDTGPALDFEGDARPRGARFDIGADEAP